LKGLTKRQSEIVKASIELISEGGIQYFTMKTLAAKLQVTEPAIYRHFSSKTDIILSMLNIVEDANKRFQAESEKEAPSLALLEQMFISKAQLFIENPEISSIVFSEEIFQNNKTFSNRVLQIMTQMNNLTRIVIEKIQQNGEVRHDISAEQLTYMIIGSLRFTIVRWKLAGFQFDLEEALKETWNALRTLLLG
jgi:AcrR family transcriptional regulator